MFTCEIEELLKYVSLKPNAPIAAYNTQPGFFLVSGWHCKKNTIKQTIGVGLESTLSLIEKCFQTESTIISIGDTESLSYRKAELFAITYLKSPSEKMNSFLLTQDWVLSLNETDSKTLK